MIGLTDLNKIFRICSSRESTLNSRKPEVEIEIQDGGGGHLEFLKTQYLSQILTDFDAVKNTRLEISCAIRKK